MCDTLVALGHATADGSTILAKNSDRSPNEVQVPVYVPRTQHDEAEVRCTHITIPQVAETCAVLLSKPFWMWGCEMGVNEHGVAIGNEAVFTREPQAETGLLGMDLIRLGLERAHTARAALVVITHLLNTHGQGGACSIAAKGTSYHNSFIIADPGQAWVLETAGRYWAAKEVRGTYSISNRLTIGADPDLASPGLVQHAVEQGWCASEADFDFARCYSDDTHRTTRSCAIREAATRAHLKAGCGQIAARTMFSALRDHDKDGSSPEWVPNRSEVAVCMHAANAKHAGQSTASLVAHLRADMPVHWMTGTSAPCTGVFKPFYVGPLPDQVGTPGGRYDEATMWWAHERLHRAVLQDYATRTAAYRQERARMEETFLREERMLYDRHYDTPTAERAAALAALTRSACERAAAATSDWEARVRAMPVRRKAGFRYRRYWRKQNRAAGMRP
jgi:secernin